MMLKCMQGSEDGLVSGLSLENGKILRNDDYVAFPILFGM